MFNSLSKCNNTEDFRLLAKSRLPAPIYHYIDGAADDEVTIKQNTKSFLSSTWFSQKTESLEKNTIGKGKTDQLLR